MICSLSWLCTEAPGPIPPFACLSTTSCLHKTEYLSDSCVKLTEEKESQQTREIKDRRNRGSVDELGCNTIQAAEASLPHRNARP